MMQISRDELLKNYLPVFELTENGLKPNDPHYAKLAEAWDNLCNEMEQIPGWYLSVTDDRVKMPIWFFGIDDGDPFINITLSSFGVVTFNAFLGPDGTLWYDTNHVEDVAPLIYAFKLISF